MGREGGREGTREGRQLLKKKRTDRGHTTGRGKVSVARSSDKKQASKVLHFRSRHMEVVHIKPEDDIFSVLVAEAVG